MTDATTQALHHTHPGIRLGFVMAALSAFAQAICTLVYHIAPPFDVTVFFNLVIVTLMGWFFLDIYMLLTCALLVRSKLELKVGLAMIGCCLAGNALWLMLYKLLVEVVSAI